MDYLSIIEAIIMLIGFATLTKLWLDSKKLYDALKDLIACVNDANADKQITVKEFNTIMSHIMTVMDKCKPVLEDIEALKKEVEVLLKRKE